MKQVAGKAEESPEHAPNESKEKFPKEIRQVENMVFDLETIPLHYDRAIGTFQQTNVASKVHHTNVVEKTISF